MVGLLLLKAVNLFQVIGTYAADWSKTHIYNTNWPPHAKFHNAQTMAMAVVLAIASLYFAWRKGGDASTNVLAAAILGAVYWVTQGLANFYSGVGWTDPEFLRAGETLNDISPQMILDPIVLGSFSSAGTSRVSRPDRVPGVGIDVAVPILLGQLGVFKNLSAALRKWRLPKWLAET
jgi:hypothetical protein